MHGIKVREFYKRKRREFDLALLTEENVGLNKVISISDVNRCGIALSGYLEYFPYHRLQVLGNAEIFYLRTLSSYDIKKTLIKILEFNVPCLVISRNLEVPKELVDECNHADVALIRTSMATTQFMNEVNVYLEDVFAPSIGMHGVLVEVYGLGILITGKSGIGKSECALELLKRGHQLVSDDLVTLKHKAGGILVGIAQEIVKHHMEIRGLGIFDIKMLFGMGSVLDKTIIQLVIELEEWDATKGYERLGFTDTYSNILGVNIPKITVPVKPGRNLGILIEIAAMNQALRNQGYNPVKELNKKLIGYMKNKRK
ncbi:MAG: HPr(Ser) kinase/phosphatase [Elusimicrobiota bacterium]